MSQELLALIGKKEVEIDKLRAELEETRKQFHGFQDFVADAIRTGKQLAFAQPEGQPDAAPMIASVEKAELASSEKEPEAVLAETETQSCGCDSWGHSMGCDGGKRDVPQITGELARFAAEMADVE